MLALRNSKPTEELDRLSAQINSRLCELPEINDANVVSTYMHIGSEVRTTTILDWLLSNGKRVVVPATDRVNRTLIFCEIKSPEKELVKQTYGILEPKLELRKPLPLNQVDAIVVPGVAWDLRGYRIGYGAGYYDRSINSTRKFLPKIGLSYEFQIIQRIPNGRFDRRVNILVTESRIINTSSDG